MWEFLHFVFEDQNRMVGFVVLVGIGMYYAHKVAKRWFG